MKAKRTGLFAKLLLIVLIAYAVTTLISLRSTIETAREETDALAQEVANMAAQNAEAKYYIENSDDDQVKEDIARDHNYVRRGEEVYRTFE